ncbi:DUF1320 domain-containing protein [Pedobacter sp. BS3]|uniref:phage protein Gp36 family protein n=1 Tax=Pedobacter sp. BS3 TaxID=2567937 RepID=UPI0011EBAFA9|nr:phage protein Gp36 family protein [Pedobacter sp. BS3]TZF81810.1 DUF1320 domain-containing protein [Pedobacter sp. BS3]
MFLTKEDLFTHIYEGAIDAISDNDVQLLNSAIAAAVSEATGYLSRFDTNALFAAEGGDRDASLLLFMKDVAKWHFINVANPGVEYEAAKERYQLAIKWLEKIQAGKISPAGWPLPESEQDLPPFIITSRPKRGNYF